MTFLQTASKQNWSMTMFFSSVSCGRHHGKRGETSSAEQRLCLWQVPLCVAGPSAAWPLLLHPPVHPRAVLLLQGTHTCMLLRGAKELCESRGGHPGLPVHNSPYGLCGHKATLKLSLSELRSCVKVEVGSLSIIVCLVSVDVKQH